MLLFAIRDYRHPFSAQVMALFGTGLATVALALLAYDRSGPYAGVVLGTALTIKVVLHVIIAPLESAYETEFYVGRSTAPLQEEAR